LPISLYIERLTDEEARSLIEQSHLDAAERPQFEEGVVESIREHCDNHPYLIQLVGKRYLEMGSLDEAIEQVCTDRMVSYFFSVDFEMLAEVERNIIRMIARESESSSNSIREEFELGPDAVEGTLRRLENLGFIRRDSENRLVLANYFFRRWLQEMQDQTTPTVMATAPVADTEKVTPEADGDDKQSADGLFAELKRRNVVRVGIAYVVVSWVLLQLGEIVLEFLEVPNWAGKLLIVFLAIGLPIALILAWAFELTPEGVKREKDIDRSKTSTHQAGRKLDFIIIAILAIAVVFFVVDKFV
jgi:hypothetical protein